MSLHSESQGMEVQVARKSQILFFLCFLRLGEMSKWVVTCLLGRSKGGGCPA